MGAPAARPPRGFLPGELQFALWNCSGLSREKLCSLGALDHAVAFLAEVGAPGDDLKTAVAARGFDAVWALRPGEGRASGGVAILWDRHRFAFTEVSRSTAQTAPVEYIVGDLTERWLPSTSLRVGVVYIPPHAVSRPAPAVAVCGQLERILGLHPSVLLGDFNARHPTWDPGTYEKSSPAACRGTALLNLLGSKGFSVSAPATPTCLRAQGGSVLDLLVTPYGGPQISPLLVHEGGDHRILTGTLGGSQLPDDTQYPWRPHPRVSWAAATASQLDTLRETILTTPLPFAPHHSVDEACGLFTHSLHSLVSPLPKVCSGRRPRGCPPSVRSTREVAARAWALVHQCARDGLPTEAAIAAARLALAAHRAACAEAEGRPTAAAFSSAAAWRLWNSATATEDSPILPVIYAPDGTPWRTAKEQADGFAALFAAKHRARAQGAALGHRIRRCGVWTPVTSAEIQAAVAALDPRKSADPDGLDAQLVSLLPPSLLAPLFDKVGREGLPRRWRQAYVTPVLKEGRPADQASSYRPVAITSLLCRVLERVVLQRLFALEAARLHPTQCGFVPGLSPVAAVSQVLLGLHDAGCQEVTVKVAGRQVLRQFRTLLVGVDLTDAFCRVRASSIERVLRQRGLPEDLIGFLLDFMSGREGRVRYRGVLSSLSEYEVGVPQGSVLGPWLFDLLVDAMHHQVERELSRVAPDASGFPPNSRGSALKLPFYGQVNFADDGLLWMSGPKVPDMVTAMNSVLAVIAKFCAAEGIEISSKSSALCVARRALPVAEALEISALHLQCGTVMIPVRLTGTERFLGVTVDDSGSLAPHVTQAVAKATKYLRVIGHLRDRLSPATARELIAGVVHSHLLYAAAAWAPHLTSNLRADLNAAWLASARVITQAVTSTAAHVVLSEAGLWPFEVTVQRAAILWIEQQRRLPDGHPMKQALFREVPSLSRHVTMRKSIRDWAPSLPSSLALRPLLPVPFPPSLLSLAPRVCIDCTPPGGLNKETTAPAVLLAANKERLRSLLLRHPDAVIVFTDGSVVPGESGDDGRSACAFSIVEGPDCRLLARGGRGLGPYPCSFTAEHGAVCLALEVLQFSAARWGTRPICLLTDSQGLLAMLGRGPCAQRDQLGSEIWARLLGLAQTHHVELAFAFSHVGWEPHDRVDELAKEALAMEPWVWPAWYRDTARAARRKVVEKYRASLPPHDWYHPPSWCQRPPRLPEPVAKFLLRLRMGVDPGVGGWKHGVSTPCMHCGAPLGRGGAGERGTEHFFRCPAPGPVGWRMELDPQGLSREDLWNPARWPLVLQYRSRYCSP